MTDFIDQIAAAVPREDAQRARTLAGLLVACVLCAIGAFIPNVILAPEPATFIGYGFAVVGLGAALALLRKGHVEAAAHLTLAIALIAVNVGAAVGGGLDGGFSVNAVVIVLAALTLPRLSVFIVAVTIVALAIAFAAFSDTLLASSLVTPGPWHKTIGPIVNVLFLGTVVSSVRALYLRSIADGQEQRQALDTALFELERTSVSKAHLDNVIAAVRDIILVTDSHNTITDANPAAEEQLGYHRSELIGRPMADLLVESDLLDAQVLRAATARVQTSDGRQLPVLVSRGRLSPNTNQIDGFVWALSDMTVQQAAIEAVKRAHAQAETANQAKSRFLANMSHELRTPLNAIIGYSELLGEDLAGRDDIEAGLEDLTRIKGAGRHLLGLINGILDLSKVEAGKMELRLEDVEIGQLVEEVLATVRPRIERKGLVLKTGTAGAMPSTVRVDAQKLRQILLNLLSNAAKFTTRGEIRLDIESWARDGMPWVRFIVVDTGIGMDAAQVERIFEPFSQADESTSRKYGGTGLGLSISRAFTRMMGGEIHVDSRKGHGTSFTVELPVGELGQLRTPGGGLRRQSPVSRSDGEEIILHIDDDTAALELVKRLLERPGRRVIGTTEPEEGLLWIERFRPELVLLDVQMPRVSGWAVLARMRDELAHADPKVLVLTAEGEEDVARALGASGLLRKPIDRKVLVDVVDSTLAL